MSSELLAILESIEREKGIDREILIQAVEAALQSAAKKTIGNEEADVAVHIDRTSGRISVRSGDTELPSGEFGRIAAQTAKQVIIQKIREAERDVIYNEFQGKVGDIVNGAVHRFERGGIVVDVGRAEALLPKSERAPQEEYRQGERVQAYVLSVQKTSKGPEILLSRVHPGLVKGLFEMEVPEIFEGIVEVRAIAREAGDRSKIAVWSKDAKVDCVGACVGMRGTRVKNIVRELHGEKIDIVRYSEDTREYIGAALSPAKIHEIQPDKEHQRALVIVDDDQLSLAIGRKGQNVRLASKLTGWHLDILSRSQQALKQLPAISTLPGVGPAMQEHLVEAGFKTIDAVAQATVEQLTQAKGVGDKTAEKLIAAAKQVMDEHHVTLSKSAATEMLGLSDDAPSTEAGTGIDRGGSAVALPGSGTRGADPPAAGTPAGSPTEPSQRVGEGIPEAGAEGASASSDATEAAPPSPAAPESAGDAPAGESATEEGTA